MPLEMDALTLDCAAESERIARGLRQHLRSDLKRRGYVVALSGGIDSSVVGKLCVEAVGSKRVFGLLLPEKDSAPETLELSRLVAEDLGIEYETRDITDILETVGCYQFRDEAIRQVVPGYGPGHKCKIVLPGASEGESLNVFSVVTQAPDGPQQKTRLSLESYLGIVAASNFKQRVRKMLEYYHADRRHYAVAGTPNLQEVDQGFFVKLGDGAADVKPIAHLYKTQVYQMAEHLGVPAEVCSRPPTTDTYPMAQTQEEFFFVLPYDKMDWCLYGKNHDVPAAEVAALTKLTEEQVCRVYDDIDTRRRTTRYLHLPPLTCAP
jgi:NAD+ synthase